VFNASISLTLATFSLRTSPAGAGSAIISGQALSSLTTSSKVFEPTIAITDKQTNDLTIRCDTAQGTAATADFLVEMESLYT